MHMDIQVFLSIFYHVNIYIVNVNVNNLHILQYSPNDDSSTAKLSTRKFSQALFMLSSTTAHLKVI